MADWTHWTSAEIAELKRRHALRQTFTEISRALPGRSRAACIGKAHKLDLFGFDRAEQCRRGFERRRAERALSIDPVEHRHV